MDLQTGKTRQRQAKRENVTQMTFGAPVSEVSWGGSEKLSKFIIAGRLIDH